MFLVFCAKFQYLLLIISNFILWVFIIGQDDDDATLTLPVANNMVKGLARNKLISRFLYTQTIDS